MTKFVYDPARGQYTAIDADRTTTDQPAAADLARDGQVPPNTADDVFEKATESAEQVYRPQLLRGRWPRARRDQLMHDLSCGTLAGFHRHRRAAQAPCDDCETALRQAIRGWR